MLLSKHLLILSLVLSMVVDLAGYVMYGFEEIAQWHAESNSSIAGRQNKYF